VFHLPLPGMWVAKLLSKKMMDRAAETASAGPLFRQADGSASLS
jgi:hypothetical protein